MESHCKTQFSRYYGKPLKHSIIQILWKATETLNFQTLWKAMEKFNSLYIMESHWKAQFSRYYGKPLKNSILQTLWKATETLNYLDIMKSDLTNSVIQTLWKAIKKLNALDIECTLFKISHVVHKGGIIFKNIGCAFRNCECVRQL